MTKMPPSSLVHVLGLLVLILCNNDLCLAAAFMKNDCLTSAPNKLSPAMVSLPVQSLLLHHRLSSGRLLLAKSGNDRADGPPREEADAEYTGEIDWDAEWQKVVRNQNQPTQRPGKDFYRSDAEIAAIKAANKAQKQAAKLASGIPTWRSLQGDWKFWIGIIAIISVGLSVLSVSGQTANMSIGSSETYSI